MDDRAKRVIKVAIVNYNSARHTLQLLDCLATERITRAVVVDNESNVVDREVLGTGHTKYDWATVVWSPSNFGFGAGINLAVEALEMQPHEYLWVINPDVRPQRGVAQSLVDTLENSPFDIVSPLLVREENGESVIVFAGGNLDLRRGVTQHDFWGEPKSAAGCGLRATTFMTGAAFMTTGRCWERLGGFREDYFLYWEDADLSAKALRHGMSMGVVCNAVAEHDTSGSSDGDGRGLVYFRFMAENRERFLEEWSPSRTVAVRVIREVQTLRLLGRAAREPADRAKKVAMVIRGRLEGSLATRRGRRASRQPPRA